MPVATSPSHRSMIVRATSVLTCTRWSSMALALVLAACAQVPQAAVQTYAGASSAKVVGCDSASSTRAALRDIDAQLHDHGMALKSSCQPNMSGLQVQVRVIDGMKASKVVRGPLADGQDVDMGTPSGISSKASPGNSRTFSPDVLHNRAWLNALMARHRFENLPDAWWHFAQRDVTTPGSADTDVAAR